MVFPQVGSLVIKINSRTTSIEAISVPNNNVTNSSIRLLLTEQGSQLVIEGKEIDDEALNHCINKLSTENLHKIQVITISNSPVTDTGVNVLLAQATQLRSLTLINTLIADTEKLSLPSSTQIKIINNPPPAFSLQKCGIYHHQKGSAHAYQTPFPPLKMHR